MVLTQLLLNSLIIGGLYALVAAGFSLIYSTNKFMHFAHGTSVVAGGYFLYAFYSLNHFPFWLAVITTLFCTALLGAGMYKIIYEPLQKRKASNVILLIASIGILILFQNIIQLIFGASIQTISIQSNTTYTILGAAITQLQIIIISISILLYFILTWMMYHTTLGKHMRAVADNPGLAKIIGIDPKKIALWSFILGATLAGIAGILIGLEQNLEPSMGTGLMIKGFTGAVIGGVESVGGAVLGSYILGAAENFGVWYLPSGYKDGIAFILLFLFLLLKPSGLFGIRKG